MGLAQLLEQILAQLLPKHTGEIAKEVAALKVSVDANTSAINSMNQNLEAIMVFFGQPAPPGTVTPDQVTETLSKIQAASDLVNQFNP
jgi:hypothetical protein